MNGLGEQLEPLRMRVFSCIAPHHTIQNPGLAALSATYSSNLDPISKILFVDLWQDDRAEVRKALKQLANLCFYDENYVLHRQTIFMVGGFSLLVSVMRQWSDCSDIQAEACRAFLNICLDCGSFICEAACGVGALEAILAAMQRFDNDAYLQRVGCGALHALTKSCAKTARRLVRELRGAFKLVRSMRSFPQSRRLQMWAYCALADWAQWEDLRQSLLDTGALSVIDQTIALFKDKDNLEDVAIQDKARNVLRILSPQTQLTIITVVVSKRQFERAQRKVRFWDE